MEFFKNLKFDKETAMKGLSIGKRIGKTIIVKGTQVLILEGAQTVLKTSFQGGVEDVKKLGLDDFIGKEKPKGSKLSLFSKKKKDETEELLDEVVDTEKPQVIEVDGKTVIIDTDGEVVVETK